MSQNWECPRSCPAWFSHLHRFSSWSFWRCARYCTVWPEVLLVLPPLASRTEKQSALLSVSAQILKHARTTLSFSWTQDEIISFCRIFTDSDDWWHCGTRHGFLLSCFRKKINWFFICQLSLSNVVINMHTEVETHFLRVIGSEEGFQNV